MSESTPIGRLNAALEGRYTIEHELGEGGMATVYLAEDVRHDRNVALKVLKPELAAVVGAERFLAEIKTTAQLQHPHILPLHDSGEADGFLFYVMPYVEGESLRDRLEREQQLPVEEALGIAEKVAAALQYAHEQGVVHRDIKPANILLSRGEPMVADFGIALAVSQAGGGRITETGLSLGTPHYMSPEQAAGERTLDKRSDVYALGCVTYEMLTGQPPFGGPNAQAVLGRILTGEPDRVTEHRKAVPANVEAAVHRSLERLPADRFESAREFAVALRNPSFTAAVGAATRGGSTVGPGRWRAAAVMAGAVAVVAIVVGVIGWLRPSGERPEVVRFTLPLSFPAVTVQAAVSPDGRRIALGNADGGTVAIRELGAVDAGTLPVEAVNQPSFSPDGTAALVTGYNQQVQVVPLDGGPTRTIAEAVSGVPTVWGEDGYVYHTLPLPDGALARVPAAGGPVDTLLARTDPELVALAPEVLLPGGRGLIYFEVRSGAPSLRVLDLETGESSHLAPASGSRSVAYSRTGHVLYASDRFLMAQPLDPGTLETTGPAVPVAEVPSGTMEFAYGGGTLVYVAGGQAGALVPRITDRAGRDRPIPGLDEGGFDVPEVSPSGDRIAMQVTGRGSEPDIWVYEMPEGPLTRLSLEGGANTTTWTRDGEYLLHLRNGDAYRSRSDGSGEPELILDLERNLARLALAPREDRLYYQIGPGDWDIGVYTLGEEGSDSLILAGDYWEGHPSISPDGRWIAYYSQESGAGSEIFIRPLAGPGRKHQVSRNGGLRPRWSSDGSELFFASRRPVGGIELWVATIADDGDDKDVADVRELFEMPTYNYDVFPGDSLFVVLRPPGTRSDSTAGEVTVVAHFDRVLEERGGR